MTTILKVLKQLLSREHRERRRLEQDISICLDQLPYCHEFVLIADPTFGRGEYNCVITLRSRELLSWAREHAQRAIIMPWHREIWRQSLPVWLEQADDNDGQTTRLPQEAFNILKSEIAEWTEAGTAQVWCYSCKNTASHIHMAKQDEKQIGNSYLSWTDVWRCPEGHKLHEAPAEMRLIRSSHRSISSNTV